MLKNSSKILLIFIVISGTLISISANSWLSAWMGLEINLLAFIPLMTANNNLMSSEASLKYFLTQTLASSILLFSSILFSTKTAHMFQVDSLQLNLYNMMMLSSLLMKTGAAPFHFWFPSVMEGLSWMNAFMLMTWQKIAPMMLISYLMIKPFLYATVIMSVIVGSMGGLNQTSLRKIMAFSSINHLGWMIAGMTSSETLWLTYFTIYSILSLNMIMMFNSFKLLHTNQLFSMPFESKPLKFILFSNLLSLGGLPPFLGFLPKWLVIQSLTLNSQLAMMTSMVILTLITLYFYIRMCYSAFMLNYDEMNWNMSNKFSNSTMYMFLILSFISTSTLFSVTLIYPVM